MYARVVRALEVYILTGKTITQHDAETRARPPRYDAAKLALDFENRQDLYDRINRRVGIMLELGLLEEIEGLLASGIPAGCTAMQAIGYKEFVDALAGKCTVEEAADQVRQSSRRYAKRQLTWFRRNPKANWLIRRPGENCTEIVEKARLFLRDFDK